MPGGDPAPRVPGAPRAEGAPPAAGSLGRRAKLALARDLGLARVPLILRIAVFVVAIVAATLAVTERSAHDQGERRLSEDASASLAHMNGEEREREHGHATFARLLADTPGLATAVRRSDRRSLTRLLAPLRDEQGGAFEAITVYDREGAELSHLGPPKWDRMDAGVFASGVSGRTSSQALVDPSGLVVLASTPILGGEDVIGVLVVAAR